jgi:hypothetical protein
MRGAFEVFSDPQGTLKRTCMSRVVVSVSALASTAVLLIQVVPTMLGGLH